MLSPILCRLCCCYFVHAELWIDRIPSVLLLLFLQLHQTCMLHSDAVALTKETALWAQREGNIFEEGSGCPVVLAKTWVSICPLSPVPLCFVLCWLHTLCWVTVGGNSGSSQLCDSPPTRRVSVRPEMTLEDGWLFSRLRDRIWTAISSVPISGTY